jgi:hypothetical protein
LSAALQQLYARTLKPFKKGGLGSLATVAVTIRATASGNRPWGVPLQNVDAVVASATRCFPVFVHESVAITLLNMNQPPMTVQDTSLPPGQAIVWLNTEGPVWAQVAFQFAHEFCHVIAEPKTMPWDRFRWLEEAICETASLFALRCMAKHWTIEPPYPNWGEYAEKLEAYASARMSQADHCLPPEVRFDAWLAERLPLLENDASRREDNTIIAKELLPIFERDSARWLAIRNLHDWPRPSGASLADFFVGWADASPVESRPVIYAIGQLLNAADVDTDASAAHKRLIDGRG